MFARLNTSPLETPANLAVINGVEHLRQVRETELLMESARDIDFVVVAKGQESRRRQFLGWPCLRKG